MLYQCYVYCSKAFQDFYPKHLKGTDVADPDKIDMFTSIIILANPGQMTSLNLRKALLLSSDIDPSQELKFVAAILTVKQNAKVSMLWHHRRWILSLFYSGVDIGLFDEQLSARPSSS